MRKITILTFLMLFTFSSNLFFAQQHPNMFLNASEVASIKAKIDAGQEPWTTAYNTALSRANTLLNQSPISVRDSGNTSWIFSSGDNRHDYNAARTMCYAIRDLGIAYAFSENDAYADKAIELIHHWTTDPASRMKPQMSSGQSWIELSITMPAMFYGADMIWNYSGWDADQKAGFINWVQDFVNVTINSNTVVPTNNFGDWRLVFLASAAVIIEDPSVIANVVTHYKKLVPLQIASNGRLTWEFDRTEPKDGLFYSTYAMIAIAQICEIVRHHGTDLYNWKASNGKGSIEKAFDYMAPFVVNPSSWTQPSTPEPYTYTGENAVGYELAYSIWQKPEYLAVINHWGRPMHGVYVQGPLTLTHAFNNTVLDISELEIENNISIYPNPTSDRFTIDLNDEILKKVIIYNQLGQQVKEATTNEVNTSNLSKGIYFLKITSQNNKIVTKKIIKN
ncbi:MAG: alginate lyase family protein [Flavobacteriaceae bacterium]|nr:alginate lyase family protein [Flavobacteriaceae bacterium]